jgi:hypothetical protein
MDHVRNLKKRQVTDLRAHARVCVCVCVAPPSAIRRRPWPYSPFADDGGGHARTMGALGRPEIRGCLRHVCGLGLWRAVWGLWRWPTVYEFLTEQRRNMPFRMNFISARANGCT